LGITRKKERKKAELKRTSQYFYVRRGLEEIRLPRGEYKREGKKEKA